uniref:Protein kinase domain-containing protein n=1 Tax=Phaeocystis antarctica TaxID=33657 RepID=A0A7S0E308_9EUKA|mmetsp:Transcript_13583/g.32227  ORF Transcript_13583/g.32227 Transcript_13583/m.32227 type:complete len:392 (+) Transcript_13583:82-1257(+)
MPRTGSASPGSDTLADQLGRAMAAVAVGSDDLEQLAADAHRADGNHEVDPEYLQRNGLLGGGGYASVWLTTDTRTGRQYALKQLRKGVAVHLNFTPRCILERQALETMAHPFITRLYTTFQDEANMYFVLELARGGDLFTVQSAQPNYMLPEAWAKFYAASLSLALRHIHSKGFVYRDLKPENVLLDENGFLKLADLGLSKKVGENRTYTQCGTEEYVPPEMLKGRGRTRASDWWAVGVFVFELLTGHPPFEGDKPSDIFDQISDYASAGDKANQRLADLLVQNKVGAAIPITHNCAAFVTSLLRAEEHRRLGCAAEGFLGIQQHPWFDGFDWAALIKKDMQPPHTPQPARQPFAEEELEPQVLKLLPYDKSVHDREFNKFGPHIQMGCRL